MIRTDQEVEEYLNKDMFDVWTKSKEPEWFIKYSTCNLCDATNRSVSHTGLGICGKCYKKNKCYVCGGEIEGVGSRCNKCLKDWNKGLKKIGSFLKKHGYIK